MALGFQQPSIDILLCVLLLDESVMVNKILPLSSVGTKEPKNNRITRIAQIFAKAAEKEPPAIAAGAEPLQAGCPSSHRTRKIWKFWRCNALSARHERIARHPTLLVCVRAFVTYNKDYLLTYLLIIPQTISANTVTWRYLKDPLSQEFEYKFVLQLGLRLEMDYYAPATNRRGIKRCFCLMSVFRVHRA